MEELLKQIVIELQEIKDENKKLVAGQLRLEKTQRSVAKDIKAIKNIS